MNRSNLFVALLVASFFIAGLFEPLHPPRGEFLSVPAIVHMLAISMLLFAWCKADSAQRGARPPAGAVVLCAFLAPVGIPYYLFRSRPWHSALIGICKAVGLFVLSGALFSAGFYAKAYAGA